MVAGKSNRVPKGQRAGESQSSMPADHCQLPIHYLRRLMEKKKQIVMSGIRPTGFLHLGNYFGAMRNYVRMQEEYDCYFCVADWHSLTTHPDTKELKDKCAQGVGRKYCLQVSILIKYVILCKVMYLKLQNCTFI